MLCKKIPAAAFAVILFLSCATAVKNQQGDEVSFISVGGYAGSIPHSEIADLVGYSVNLPERLGAGFFIANRSIGAGLSVPVNDSDAARLSPVLEKAVLNKAAFNELAQYRPYRSYGAFYSSRGRSGNAIVVGTMPEGFYEAVEERPLKENAAGSGIKISGIYIDGISADLIEYPAESKQPLCLAWKMNGTAFMLFGLEGTALTLREASDAARDVIRANRR